MAKWTVGGNVDSWCTKCKLVLAHTIEAIADGEIKRVHCNTCKGKHSYRATEPGVSVRAVSAKPSKGKSASSSLPKDRKGKITSGMVKAGDYDRLVIGRDLSSLKPYSVKTLYIEGELISHQLFGVGVVTVDKGFNKIEILFQEGPKVLIHGRI